MDAPLPYVSPPVEPEYYPNSEYLRLLKLVESKTAATICNLGVFYKSPFDELAVPIRDPMLLGWSIQSAIRDFPKE
jgi:hypothetical protein